MWSDFCYWLNKNEFVTLTVSERWQHIVAFELTDDRGRANCEIVPNSKKIERKKIARHNQINLLYIVYMSESQCVDWMTFCCALMQAQINPWQWNMMHVTCTTPIELNVGEKNRQTIVGFILTYFKLIEIALFHSLDASFVPFGRCTCSWIFFPF